MGNIEIEAQSLRNMRRCVKWLAERERLKRIDQPFPLG
jgi:hypothetical protein